MGWIIIREPPPSKSHMQAAIKLLPKESNKLWQKNKLL